MAVHDTDKLVAVRKALGIPADEPIFVFRAQDMFALPVLARYRNMATEVASDTGKPDGAWFEQLDEHVGEFEKWRAKNKNKVKVPD